MMNLNELDQFNRQQALDPKLSFIVQAPAGSGKTELLIQRYLVLLSRAEKAPEEILAITFTRKAAAEMKERILAALEFAAHHTPPHEPHRLITWKLAHQVLIRDQELHWHLRDNPHRLHIFTIDAWCGMLCSQMPVLAQFGGKPVIIEDATALYQRAAERVIEYLTDDIPESDAIKQLLLHLDNRAQQLIDLFSNMLARRDQWLPHIVARHLNIEKVKAELELGLKHLAIANMRRAKQLIPKSIEALLIPLACFAGNYLFEQQSHNSIAACRNLHNLPEAMIEHFPIWLGIAELLLTKEGEWRKSINKNQGFPPKNDTKIQMESLLAILHEHELLRLSLIEIQKSPPLQYNATQWLITESLIKILPLLAAELNILFQQQQNIDFTEQSLGSLRALGTRDEPTDLTLYLDYKLRHILMDEFQDTSILQYELIEKLINHWQSGDNRTIFLVGDPMQSIYRFRNAEVGLFLRTKEQGIGSMALKSLTLYNNFRAQENLVAWNNLTFQHIFPKRDDMTTGAVSYTLASATHTHSLATENIFYYLSSNQSNDAEANQVVQIVQRYQEVDPQATIAILVRSRTHLETITRLFRKLSIAFQAVDIEPLYQRSEIQDLITLTRAMTHFADRIAWLALLRAPWCGLMLKDLLIIAQATRHKTIWETIKSFQQLNNLSQDAQTRLKSIAFVLQEAFNQRGRISYSQWIQGIWIALGGPATIENEDALESTERFFDLLRKLEQESCFINPQQLPLKLKKYYAKAPSHTNPRIQIMTIHKSKGLEFDHVIIPGLSHKPRPDSEKILLWQEFPNYQGGQDLILAPIKSAAETQDPIYQYLKHIEKIKADHETARLLYVAATRAKKTLHLLGQIEKNEDESDLNKHTANDALFAEASNTKHSPPSGSFLAMLWPNHQQHFLHNYFSNVLDDHQIVEETTHHLKRFKATWKIPHFHATIAPLHQPNSAMPRKQMGLPLSYAENIPKIIGTVIHEAIFLIAEQGLMHWSREKIAEQMNRWLFRMQQLGLPENHLPHAENLITTALNNILEDDRCQWIFATEHLDIHNEWALTGMINNTITHIIIDRSFVDQHGTRWIIDYKTSTPDQLSIVEFLTQEQEKYHPQLQQYATILFKLENKPIKLGLFFPLANAWCEWEFDSNVKFSDHMHSELNEEIKMENK